MTPNPPPRQAFITDSEFHDEFRPVSENMVHDSESSDGPKLFETYGAELETVKKADPNKVWTLLDADEGDPIIGAGFSFVNRIGYYITEKPFQNLNTAVIDEPRDFFKAAKKRGGLDNIEVVYELSPGMLAELEGFRASLQSKRKVPKPKI